VFASPGPGSLISKCFSGNRSAITGRMLTQGNTDSVRTVRFTLSYDGTLPSRGTASDKQQIREALDPQLRELWTHEPLVNYPEFLQVAETNKISVLLPRGDHVFAPLICKPLRLLAELDILMLRPELPGGIVTSGGDIDNRLKTLFDALRVPGVAQEIASSTRPSSTKEPNFTLLEDDALITRVNVETDRALGRAGSESGAADNPGQRPRQSSDPWQSGPDLITSSAPRPGLGSLTARGP
jgi:hypothetical protein